MFSWQKNDEIWNYKNPAVPAKGRCILNPLKRLLSIIPVFHLCHEPYILNSERDFFQAFVVNYFFNKYLFSGGLLPVPSPEVHLGHLCLPPAQPPHAQRGPGGRPKGGNIIAFKATVKFFFDVSEKRIPLLQTRNVKFLSFWNLTPNMLKITVEFFAESRKWSFWPP